MNTPHSAIKALIHKDGKYLVLLSTYGKEKIPYHDLPGVRIQSFENPFEALKREVREEIQCEIEIWDSLGLWWFDRIDNIRVLCHTFLCNLKDETIDISKNPSQDEDIEGYIWMTKQELLDSKLFQNASIYEIFRKLPE